MHLPSIKQCRDNKRSLVNKWLKNKEFSNDDLVKAKEFFKKCFVFHHFVIPDNYIGVMEGQIPKILADGELKSDSELKKIGCILGRYFYSYGPAFWYNPSVKYISRIRDN